MVLDSLTGIPPDLTRNALINVTTGSLTDQPLSFVWAIRLFVKQQYICLELYHRYLTLLPSEKHNVGHSKIARIAGNLISTLSPLPKDCIDAIGPPYLDMVYRACQYLQECITHLDDPFDRQQATSDTSSYFSLLDQVDSLRRVNAIVSRPRAYDGTKSVQPSRAPSPSQQALPSAPSFPDPGPLLFNEPWQPSTSFADPSIGSMGLVNILPYFNVPGYQQALEAYAYSPSDTGTMGEAGYANS